jgi:two-component system response regulator MtrA
MSALVLVVDDDEDTVQIMATMLRGEGFEVREAFDGASALRSIDERRPDLVLLDLMMPGMDGLEVLRRIRRDPRHPGLPVILVTARTGDEDVLGGYRGGADYYIIKPVTRRQLLHGVGLVLGSAEGGAAGPRARSGS